MRKILYAAVAVLGMGSAWGQSPVFLNEAKIQASLKGGVTGVALPIEVSGSRDLPGSLSLQWLGTNDNILGSVQRSVVLKPGTSTIETPFGLPESDIWLRLRYALTPDRSDPRSFLVQQGVVSLSQIAGHAFELKIGNVGQPLLGSRYVVRAQAIHPGTREPANGVKWAATLSIADKKIAPASIRPLEGGFVELAFDLPKSAGKSDDDPDDLKFEVEVTATLGDFTRTESSEVRLSGGMLARLQTDKPMYQPGQTIHLRALVLDAQGHAAEGVKVQIHISQQDNQRVHTAHLVSSRFGVVQDDWTLPESTDLGLYTIAVRREGEQYRQLGYHSVRVSRYELPTFSLSTKADRAAYLPDQNAKVEIHGDYLFGKPVPNGSVKIVKTEDRGWNPRTGKYDTDEQTIAEGQANASGVYVANLDLAAGFQKFRDDDGVRFHDQHYAAYYTDPSSGRTEQKRFDVRLTRQPLHIYLFRDHPVEGTPSPVFVSTYYADGLPAETTVELKLKGQTATARTNKYGVGKALLVGGKDDGREEISARAVDASGAVGTWTEKVYSIRESLQIDAGHTLFRTNEAVSLHLTAPNPQTDRYVVVDAIAADRSIARRLVHVVNGKADVVFPYQPEFRREVVFVAWNGEGKVSRYENKAQGTRTVVFPDRSDLQLTITPEKATYRPGEKAALKMMVRSAAGDPVESALGIAIVDQSVLEQARTDSEFGERSWFSCAFCRNSEMAIGDIQLTHLINLDPKQAVPDGLDLVAEALVSNVTLQLQVEGEQNLLEDQRHTFKKFFETQLASLRRVLETHYLTSLDYPRTDAALNAIARTAWSQLRDPWGRPYSAKFSIEGSQDVMEVLCSGPDKLAGTVDDFSIGKIQRAYFLPVQRLIQLTLDSQRDYPESTAAFQALLLENGLQWNALRDPWGSSYRTEVFTRASDRIIVVNSAGPDRIFDSEDDFMVTSFRGRYFQHETDLISQGLKNNPSPKSDDEFLRLMNVAGLDLAKYRDAWGHPYRLQHVEVSNYVDRRSYSTDQIYKGPIVVRTNVIPVTQIALRFSVRSDGEDGQPGTFDDFDVAAFPVVQHEEAASSEVALNTKNRPAKGSGMIVGNVGDPSGASIGGVTVYLTDGSNSREAVASASGGFAFTSLAEGLYSIRIEVPGFKIANILEIPVSDGNTTIVDVEMQVGAVSESVTVTDSAALLNTQSSSLAVMAIRTGTPRVREYFPETLLWNPELLTDAKGSARLEFALADSVTTWKVAAIASTLDGRIVETTADLRAFQPFFIEFNPPTVLTSGDQVTLPVIVRNYQDRDQNVTVTFQNNAALKLDGPDIKTVSVAKDSSANVGYSVLTLTTGDIKPRIAASAGANRDAIEKPIHVHPDGQEITKTYGDLISGTTRFSVAIPNTSIAGATRGEIRLYPSTLSLLLESANALLIMPHGCAEQTISAGYANLIALQYARSIGMRDAKVEKVALTNILRTRDALANFRQGDGGIRYWSTGDPDIAVTALALSFLIDAKNVIEVDTDDLKEMVAWLARHQASDGRWKWSLNGTDSLLLTGLVTRALAAAKHAGIDVPSAVFATAYHELAQATDALSEPYMLAEFLLSALDSGDEAILQGTALRLAKLAREERGAVYWDLKSNTPFYGWGTAGRLETSALTVSALAAWSAKHPGQTDIDSAIRRGVLFLLRERDREGSWYTTQATVRVMDAITHAIGKLAAAKGGTIEVRVNGQLARTVNLADGSRAVDPILLDVSGMLTARENRVELVPTAGIQPVVVNMVETHWLPWASTQPRRDPELRLSVQFDQRDTAVGETIRCSVKAERVGFRGYGMMLAEIGLPPGSEVDRSSLEKVLDTSGVSRYDILPDRVILYLWPKAGGSSFEFNLHARVPMIAKSERSILYDYYNPEVLAEIAPIGFIVR